MQAEQQKLQSLQQEVISTRQTTNQAQQQIDNLKPEFEGAQANIETAQRVLNSNSARVEQLTNQKSQLQTQNANFQNNIIAAESIKSSLESEITNWDQTTRKIQKERDDLVASTQQYRKTLDEIRARNPGAPRLFKFGEDRPKWVEANNRLNAINNQVTQKDQELAQRDSAKAQKVRELVVTNQRITNLKSQQKSVKDNLKQVDQ